MLFKKFFLSFPQKQSLIFLQNKKPDGKKFKIGDLSVHLRVSLIFELVFES